MDIQKILTMLLKFVKTVKIEVISGDEPTNIIIRVNIKDVGLLFKKDAA